MTVSTGSQLDTLVKREDQSTWNTALYQFTEDEWQEANQSQRREARVDAKREREERKKKINVRHTKNSKAQLCTGVKMSDRESPAAALILLFLSFSLSWPSERINRRKHPSCVRSTGRGKKVTVSEKLVSQMHDASDERERKRKRREEERRRLSD